jgi:toxin FitB
VILLDTNVLSELRRPKPSKSVVNFTANLSQEEIFTSVISIGELAFGISRLPAGRRSRELIEWLRELEVVLGERIIAPDVETALIWGELSARLMQSRRIITTADSWIAATALRHGMTLTTRNVRHVQYTGLELINRWGG